MPDGPHDRQDFVDTARHQLAQISAEFEKALAAVKDPQRRKQLTASYLDLLQKGLAKAQDSVAKIQQRLAAQTPTTGPDVASPAVAGPTTPPDPAPSDPAHPDPAHPDPAPSDPAPSDPTPSDPTPPEGSPS